MRLRGINFGGWFSQIDAIEGNHPQAFGGRDHHLATFLSRSDFAQVAQWGFDHVRLPVDYDVVFGPDGAVDEAVVGHLDQAVQWAKDVGLILILDLHRCPGHTFDDVSGDVQPLFSDPRYADRTAAAWTALAQRFGTCDHVWFEPLNEPVAPTPGHWNELLRRLHRVIRRVSDNPIVFGSNMWNWPSTFPDLVDLGDSHTVACFHFYEPVLFTHQRAPWLPEPEFARTWRYPGDFGAGVVRHFGHRFSAGRWDAAAMEAAIAPVLRYRDRTRIPVLCDEFGVYPRAPREDQLRWVADFLGVLAACDIGFSYWTYKNLDFGVYCDEPRHRDAPQYANAQRFDAELCALLRSM